MLYASLVESSHRALATPDIVIIGFYFALVFGIGMYFARRERTSLARPCSFRTFPPSISSDCPARAHLPALRLAILSGWHASFC